MLSRARPPGLQLPPEGRPSPEGWSRSPFRAGAPEIQTASPSDRPLCASSLGSGRGMNNFEHVQNIKFAHIYYYANAVNPGFQTHTWIYMQ